MKYAMIVNPIAGNGKAKKIFERLRSSSYLRGKTIFYETAYRGHAGEIVPQIEQKITAGAIIDIIFVIGGDGTVHEVINALTNEDLFLAYIPGGSGNDFGRYLPSYKSPEMIVKQAIEGKKQ